MADIVVDKSMFTLAPTSGTGNGTVRVATTQFNFKRSPIKATYTVRTSRGQTATFTVRQLACVTLIKPAATINTVAKPDYVLHYNVDAAGGEMSHTKLLVCNGNKFTVLNSYVTTEWSGAPSNITYLGLSSSEAFINNQAVSLALRTVRATASIPSSITVPEKYEFTFKVQIPANTTASQKHYAVVLRMDDSSSSTAVDSYWNTQVIHYTQAASSGVYLKHSTNVQSITHEVNQQGGIIPTSNNTFKTNARYLALNNMSSWITIQSLVYNKTTINLDMGDNNIYDFGSSGVERTITYQFNIPTSLTNKLGYAIFTASNSSNFPDVTDSTTLTINVNQKVGGIVTESTISVEPAVLYFAAGDANVEKAVSVTGQDRPWQIVADDSSIEPIG